MDKLYEEHAAKMYGDGIALTREQLEAKVDDLILQMDADHRAWTTRCKALGDLLVQAGTALEGRLSKIPGEDAFARGIVQQIALAKDRGTAGSVAIAVIADEAPVLPNALRKPV